MLEHPMEGARPDPQLACGQPDRHTLRAEAKRAVEVDGGPRASDLFPFRASLIDRASDALRDAESLLLGNPRKYGQQEASDRSLSAQEHRKPNPDR